MNLIRYAILFILLIGCNSCRKDLNVKNEIEEAIELGEFTKTEHLLNEQIEKNFNNEELTKAYRIQLETISRIRKEFTLTQGDVLERLEPYFPGVTGTDLDKWEEAKQLEMRIIDGEKRYFNRSVSNFFRLNKEAKKRKESLDGKGYDGVEDFQQNVIPGYFEKGIEQAIPFDPKKIKVNYTIRLKPNVVPDRETVKCWLPYPRIHNQRLPEVEFLNASQEEYIIAPEEMLQRTVYMEKTAIKDSATVFSISYIFHTSAQWFGVTPDQVKPYDKSGDIYREYTAERKPHIVFSDEVRSLAKQITGKETNPAEQVKMLYYWLNDNIPWAGALEYSTMSCIPEYVLENRRGDCGMQTFLFLSMARSLGIPCKWQSGWYLLPQEKNLHDWAEVYYEGIGWVPVDISFKLIDSYNEKIKEFYLNGIDSYRLIVNDDFAKELYPKKKYYRSEPYDFQRGELEWEGGNLYFDQWSYSMEVEYLD